MKKFKGHKTVEQIRAQCLEQGVPFEDGTYSHDGAHRCYLGLDGSGRVTYNTRTGQFHGTTPRGITFDSSSPEIQDRAWFQALQAFFWIEDTVQFDLSADFDPDKFAKLVATEVKRVNTRLRPLINVQGTETGRVSAADIVTANRPAAPQRRPSTRLTRMAAGVLAANGGAA